MNVVLTLPARFPWDVWARHYRRVFARQVALEWKLRAFPASVRPGDRCYFVHRGEVKGWLGVAGLALALEPGADPKDAERLLLLEGPFRPMPPFPMRGFRGFRYAPNDLDALADAAVEIAPAPVDARWGAAP